MAAKLRPVFGSKLNQILIDIKILVLVESDNLWNGKYFSKSTRQRNETITSTWNGLKGYGNWKITFFGDKTHNFPGRTFSSISLLGHNKIDPDVTVKNQWY